MSNFKEAVFFFCLSHVSSIVAFAKLKPSELTQKLELPLLELMIATKSRDHI